jgi:hypothetical protein
MKEFIIRAKKQIPLARKSIPLAVVCVACLFGVISISTFTVDKMFDTEWVVNEDYNPNATPVFGEVCGETYGTGEQCTEVLYNERDYSYGYYISYNRTMEAIYGYGEHTSFLRNNVPTNPLIFFVLFYGVLFGFGVKRIVVYIKTDLLWEGR